MVTTLLVSQDGGTVTIGCNGIGEQFGGQLAGVLTEILQRRLDPQQVISKLGDLEPVPDVLVDRVLDAPHRQLIIQALFGQPAEQIAISADPLESDAGEYGKTIATALMMIGWQIEGNQISRKALPGLDHVHGLALLVHDPLSPPKKAEELKAALLKAQVEAPYRAAPTLAGDATMLWIGKRPSFNPLDPKS